VCYKLFKTNPLALARRLKETNQTSWDERVHGNHVSSPLSLPFSFLSFRFFLKLFLSALIDDQDDHGNELN
jgi:hypothetical protein